jgi:hypothetical protein
VASAAAVTVCCCDRPSDQALQSTGLPPGVWGEGANSVCRDLRGTLRVNGTTWFVLSTVRLTPVRFDWNVRFTRFGVMLTFFVVVSPPLSVAVTKMS